MFVTLVLTSAKAQTSAVVCGGRRGVKEGTDCSGDLTSGGIWPSQCAIKTKNIESTEQSNPVLNLGSSWQERPVMPGREVPSEGVGLSGVGSMSRLEGSHLILAPSFPVCI